MVGRGYTKETVGLLNINSIHLYTLFDGRFVVIPKKPWGCKI